MGYPVLAFRPSKTAQKEKAKGTIKFCIKFSIYKQPFSDTPKTLIFFSKRFPDLLRLWH